MTYPKAISNIRPNSISFEQDVFVTPTGFREYDARWLYPDHINLRGIQSIGAALGTQIYEHDIAPRIIVGHDYRSYSMEIKQSLILGLVTAGIEVIDIGLCTSPMAYFAQFHLDVKAVAMVTASHNENGWTGIKMGLDRPLTHGPKEILRLKEIVYQGEQQHRSGGTHRFNTNIQQAYIQDFLDKFPTFTRPIKAVIATGNGTAGLVAEDILKGLGLDVVSRHTKLDHTFPHYNPNPEDMTMLHDLSEQVKIHGADIGLAFDGDADRCGIVDQHGQEIFADKAGLMIARDLVKDHPDAHFIVDVKSTGLFIGDSLLKQHHAQTEYWKTGHSYMKRRAKEKNALAGFEKSGHYFLGEPIGRGYDDGFLSAILLCQLLEKNPTETISSLYDALPVTYLSPTMSPYCADDIKYKIIDQITEQIKMLYQKKTMIAGRIIEAVTDVNGIRFTFSDGSWGLIRASSNKPNLVVVTESTQSHKDMILIFQEIKKILSGYDEIGVFDQEI